MLVQKDGDGSRILIGFEHHIEGKDRMTICRVIRKTADGYVKVVEEAAARCSDHDNFSKDVGRKLSMQRVLQGFPREFRAKAWHAYWTRGTQPNA